MKHLIIDTDIGGDPDDLFALFLALKSPEVKIELIITSDEFKGHRVSFANRVLSETNQSIPVIFGSDIGHDFCCVVESIVPPSNPQDFIPVFKEKIAKFEKVEYLCIGPQTNLARIIKEVPEAKSKLNIYIMGGNFSKEALDGKIEHNIRYDIKSAQTVISSGWNQNWVIAEITYDERLAIRPDNELFNKVKSNPKLSLIELNCDLFWNKIFPQNYLHDPITFASIISNEVIEFAPMQVIMNDEGLLTKSKNGFSINVSSLFNVNSFLELLNRIF